MPDRLDPTEGADTDLDRTDELPVLDFASYEATVALSNLGPVIRPAPESHPPWDESRPNRVALLSLQPTSSGIEHRDRSPNAHGAHDAEAVMPLRASLPGPTRPADRIAAELDVIRSTLHDERQRSHATLAGMLDERADKTARIEAQLAAVCAQVARAERELAQCAASIAGLVESDNGHASAVADLVRTVAGLRAELTERINATEHLEAEGCTQTAISLSPRHARPSAQCSHQAVTRSASAPLEMRDRETAGYDPSARDSASERDVAARLAVERAKGPQATAAALAQLAAPLATARERLPALDCNARIQDTRLDAPEAALAAPKSLAERADVPRLAVETILERLTAEQACQSQRATAMEARHGELAMQLEATRRALEERDLQIRRLERQLAGKAQRVGGISDGVAGSAPPHAVPRLAADASAALVALGGNGDLVLAPSGRTTIGRAADNDLCLREASISRHHAVLDIGSDGAFIEDCETINGVAVNGRRVRRAPLAEGDVITLGLRRFRFTTRVGLNAGPR